jgi:uncharacterized membrane protein YcjF (UPF0283 family)
VTEAARRNANTLGVQTSDAGGVYHRPVNRGRRFVTCELKTRWMTEGLVMGDTHDDPTDHSRTTQPHAGIAIKDNFFWPALVLVAVAAVAMISTAVAAAYRHYEWLPTTVLIAGLAAIASVLWCFMEYRRVIRVEARWNSTHPGSRSR